MRKFVENKYFARKGIYLFGFIFIFILFPTRDKIRKCSNAVSISIESIFVVVQCLRRTESLWCPLVRVQAVRVPIRRSVFTRDGAEKAFDWKE